MRLFLIFALCADLSAKCALAEGENEVKRGAFSFMAFVYYTDKTVVDGSGGRFMRGAVLLRNDWLISSSLEDGDSALAFPKKTLVARVGAVRIDSKFTLYEDEEEQEREIIQIARPFNYSATEWWFADISLLKTLFPFNTTSTVYPASFNRLEIDKKCFILIYAPPSGNTSGDKMLMQLSVEMLPSSPENCGSNFMMKSMACAKDTDDTKKYPSYCEGNSGSPLVCDHYVIGIQTFIHDCKPPHLYQILNAWENLITCSVEDKCREEQCSTICNVINKDPVDVPTQEIHTEDESKLYPDENHPTNEGKDAGERRLLPDESSIVPEKISSTSNTETTTLTSTEIYTTQEPPVSRETEEPTQTVTEHHDEEQDTSITSVSSTGIPFNPETGSTMNVYHTIDTENIAEDFKNLVENERQGTVQARQHKVSSVASVTVHSFHYVMSAILIIIYFT